MMSATYTIMVFAFVALSYVAGLLTGRKIERDKAAAKKFD